MAEKPPQAATVATYGAGCGTPTLSLQPQAGSLPLIGGMFQADVSNASFGFAAMAVGTDDQQWGGMPLPLALDPFGIETDRPVIESVIERWFIKVRT